MDPIDGDTREWNAGKIGHIFWPAKALPIKRQAINSSGILSHAITKCKRSRPPRKQVFIRLLWFPRGNCGMFLVTVPTKVKHFAYKIITNASCRENLARKRIKVMDRCPLCHPSVLETLDHLFLTCEWARVDVFAHPRSLQVMQ